MKLPVPVPVPQKVNSHVNVLTHTDVSSSGSFSSSGSSGSFSSSGSGFHVDPEVVAGVASVAAVSAGTIAIGSMLTSLLPLLAFGKRDVNYDAKAFEDAIQAILKAENPK